MSLISTSGLSFFKAEEYKHLRTNVCDFRNIPRPHSCMGLILEGEATFTIGLKDIEVKRGDIIFVPITSKYISRWSGNPNIRYISFHFIFDTPSGLFTSRKLKLQKVTLSDAESLENDFTYILNNYEKEENSLGVLSRFFGILEKLEPKLESKSAKHLDEKIEKAIDYIEQHYREPLSVPKLAGLVNMSVSGFYLGFKKATGITPVDYKNQVCVKHAMRMLIDDNNDSIEEISDKLGFSSATYFRRIFKKIVGKSPRDYKKSAIEL